MKSDKKKYFAPINNFAALKEAEEKYYITPGSKEINDFITFWNETYELWLSVMNTQINQSRLDHKIEVRKKLNGMKFLT
ncbi:MAG: hypothetical protein Q8M94_06485 [Ignavibacteria bacterium]|nr:hypothetical protein [Ignavibacteria bacterium]